MYVYIYIHTYIHTNIYIELQSKKYTFICVHVHKQIYMCDTYTMCIYVHIYLLVPRYTSVVNTGPGDPVL